ncbi:MAG: Rrf2 family transcriptional regulator [Candidatus Epulonipiscioides saccharophilum]|nr:MAG: Rrf2 family transcriptional regulator [Epulopiscium sp. AS2M-Bin001]
MKLSTKGRYGLKAMIDIGIYAKEKPRSLKSVSKRLDISESYLEQLLSKLRKENLVKSTRGSKGGYVLAKDAEQITVGDILRALEGSLAPTKCSCETSGCNCTKCCGQNDSNGKCATKSVWDKMRNGINAVVDNIYLSELILDYEKVGNNNDMETL